MCPFALTVLAQRDSAGRWQGCTAVLRDSVADTAMHQQTQRQNQILSAITEALPATVVIVDSQGRYRYVNSAFERYVGRPAAEILDRTASEVLGADEVARRRPFMKQAFAGEPVEFVLDYPSPEGTTWLALSCLPIQLDGVFDGFVGISQDITMQRREQERLAHLAERDPLTGLLNRAGFEQRLQQQRAQGEGDELALLYIDLDHFKAINDTLGHAAGDQLLQGLAARLQRAVRSTDLVARLGGDEFAILLAGVCDRAIAKEVGDKVLATVSRPFHLEGQTRQVSASIGVAVLPREQASVVELLREADARLYRAKAGGRGRQVGDEDDPCTAAPGPSPALPAARATVADAMAH
jgi:diguanylate cyclase (GGDEF)-like protein/PAS domain S-box-containing protein